MEMAKHKTKDSEIGTTVNTEELKSFDNLLGLVGTSGLWNVLVLTLASFASFISALQSISYQFLGATPEYWCHVGPLVEANWTHEQILRFAIPWNNETGKYEGCQMYDYDYEQAVALGYEDRVRESDTSGVNDKRTVVCTVRDFNLSEYKSTVTTEWDLVCDRLALYSTTQAVVPVGKLIGFLIFGFVMGKFGRRPTALFCSAMYTIAAFATAASPTVEIYITMKTLICFFDAGLYLACFVSGLSH